MCNFAPLTKPGLPDLPSLGLSSNISLPSEIPSFDLDPSMPTAPMVKPGLPDLPDLGLSPNISLPIDIPSPPCPLE